MADFPIPNLPPCVTLQTYSPECLGMPFAASTGTMNGLSSAVWPSANLALLLPFTLSRPIVAVKMFIMNGATAAGNLDLGIYTLDGTRLVSKGTTAQAGTNALQVLDITDTALGPGAYYLAVAMDGTAGTAFRGAPAAAVMQGVGMAQAATAFVLPATLTPASPTVAYIPLVGLTTRSVV